MGAFLKHFLLYILSQNLSMNLEFMDSASLASQHALGFSVSAF